jgi:2-dehydropantoate 2-reductase
MRFLIVGAGGVGGYLGARLVQAGHDVSFVARGSTLATLTGTGLQVVSPLGDMATGPLKAAEDPATLGPVDCAIITVKLYDLAAMAKRVKPALAPGACVVPVQNGVEAHDILAAALGPGAALKGTIHISSFTNGPGRIDHKSNFCRLRFAEPDGQPSARTTALAAALNTCTGVEATVSPDIEADLWRKFVMLAAFAAVSCLSNSDCGRVLGDPEARSLFSDAIEEVAAVGRARGVALPYDIAAAILKLVETFPARAKPSMQEDWAAGRPLELSWLSGAVVRLGAAAKVPTPIHGTAWRALAMHKDGKKG